MLSKIKKSIKTTYFAAAGLTFLLGLVVFAVFSAFPFAKRTIAWCDMKQQVIPLMLEFRQILLGDGDFFLNLQNAGGMSFYSIFFFFLSSPLSFLVLLIRPAALYSVINLFVLVKLSASAATASLYFNKAMTGLDFAQNTALSVMYGFCGYGLLYFQNLVWLDAMILFPLLLLSIRRVFNNRKIDALIASLSSMLVLSFYLSYMVVLFLILACVIYSFFCYRRSIRARNLHLIAIGTICSFLLTAVVWLPQLFSFLRSSRGRDILTSITSGGPMTHWETTLMMLFCSSGVFAGLILFLFVRPASSRRTASLGLILCLLTIPLIYDPINKMWHTGSYQAFPSRYGFMTGFIGLAIAGEAILSASKRNERLENPGRHSNHVFIDFICELLIVIAAAIGGGVLFEKREALSSYVHTLWMSTEGFLEYLKFFIPLLLAFFVVFVCYSRGLLRRERFGLMICTLASIQAVFCGGVFMGFVSNDVSFNEELMTLSGLVSDKDLYRVKQYEKNFDVNLVGALGYPSLSHYTSFTDRDYQSFVRNMGYSGYWMEVSSCGGTKFSDYILGNRYTIYPTWKIQDQAVIYMTDRFAFCMTSPGAGLTRVFRIGDLKSAASLTRTDRILKQNRMYRILSGDEENLIAKIRPSATSNVTMIEEEIKTVSRIDGNLAGVISYHRSVEGKKTLYFDLFHQVSTRLREQINASCNIYLNGELLIEEYPTQRNNGILELGTFENEDVRIDVEVLKDINATSFGLYELDDDRLEQFMSFSSGPRAIQRGNTIEIEADSDGEEYLLLSMPYLHGYSAKVNGTKKEIEVVFDDLMSVRLEKGKNNIVFSYIPEGFIPGLVISSVCCIILIILILLRKKLDFDLLQKLDCLRYITYYLYCALFCIVLCVLYFLPVILRFMVDK